MWMIPASSLLMLLSFRTPVTPNIAYVASFFGLRFMRSNDPQRGSQNPLWICWHSHRCSCDSSWEQPCALHLHLEGLRQHHSTQHQSVHAMFAEHPPSASTADAGRRAAASVAGFVAQGPPRLQQTRLGEIASTACNPLKTARRDIGTGARD